MSADLVAAVAGYPIERPTPAEVRRMGTLLAALGRHFAEARNHPDITPECTAGAYRERLSRQRLLLGHTAPVSIEGDRYDATGDWLRRPRLPRTW